MLLLWLLVVAEMIVLVTRRRRGRGVGRSGVVAVAAAGAVTWK